MCLKKKTLIKKQPETFTVDNNERNLSLFYYKNQKFLIINKKKNNISNTNQVFYQSVPDILLVKNNQNLLVFESVTFCLNKTLFTGFQKRTLYTLKNLNKIYRKKLILKGLGMRIYYNAKLHILKLKLGFSFLININVPESIKIFINKNLLILESVDAVLVGNFAYYVYSLKLPNMFNGKGFWFKNQQIQLKTVKKV